ncbi:MAG: AsmA protein [Granulosicoccus sp.]|jgi:AsmA protein
MKLIKIALSIVTLLILLLVAAVILLPQFINPNDYKDQIVDVIKQNTGLEATIDGDLSLSVFPWLGVSTGKAVLKQPTIIQTSVPTAGDFIDLEAMDIKVKLAPLISRKVEIDTILLKQPRIEFVVNAKGQNSLSGLQKTTPAASAPTTTEAVTPPNDATAIAALTIAGVNISDGQLIFDNRQTKTRYELTQLNIKSGNILEAVAPLSISGKVSGNTIQPITLSLNSRLQANKNTMEIAINDLRASITQASNNVDISLDALTYQHAQGLSQLSNISIDATAKSHPLTLTIPAISVDLNKAHARIPSFTADSHNAKLSGDIDIKGWDKLPMAIGHIESNTIDLQQLLAKLGVNYAPSKSSALKAVSFSTRFNATVNGASLQKTTINIDSTTLQGDVAVVNFAKPKYRFDLALNSIIIDDYLPIPTALDSGEQQSKPPTATEALAAPIILLKDIYANGTFKADKITANKIVLTDSVINVASTDSKVTITPTVNLYQGKLAGSIILQRGNTPTLLIKNALTGVNLKPLLTDADVTDQFSGIANINTNITVSEKTGKPSTKGTVVFSVTDGAIEGVDIKKVLDDAQNTIDKIRGKSFVENTNATEDSTRFAELTATLLIDNDIISNNDLSMKAPAFRINGNGSVNTAAQTLDYLTSIIVVNTNAGQGGEDLTDLKGVTIPVRFTGQITAPKYAIDTKALLKANTTKKVAEEKERLKKKLSEKLKLDDNPETGQSSEDALKDKLKKKLFDKLF